MMTRSAPTPDDTVEPVDRPRAAAARKSRLLRRLALFFVLVVLAGTAVIEIYRSSNDSSPQPASSPTPGAQNGDPRTTLDAPVGFGRNTTGGKSGPVTVISTDADNGPGSLREALAGDGPAWVTFSRDLTIRLLRGINVGSNKTIDGRGHHVTLTGPGTDGLLIVGVKNVIVESLTLTGFGNTAATSANDTPDALHIERSSDVWISHCDLSKTGDKLISVVNGAQAITVSWSHFHDQEQVFQIGDQSSAKTNGSETVTVHHNYFDGTGYRAPVLSYGRAHVFDNVYRDWKQYAVRVQRAGQMYLEDNVFIGGTAERVVLTTPQGDGCNDTRTRCDDRPGYLVSAGNTTTGTRNVRSSSPELVFKPAALYSYSAEPAGPALEQKVREAVGPRA